MATLTGREDDREGDREVWQHGREDDEFGAFWCLVHLGCMIWVRVASAKLTIESSRVPGILLYGELIRNSVSGMASRFKLRVRIFLREGGVPMSVDARFWVLDLAEYT